MWRAGRDSFWNGFYSRLSSDGEKLLFSTSDTIYSYDVKTNRATQVVKPSLSAGNYFSIFGFMYSDGHLIVDRFNKPNFTAEAKLQYQIKLRYTAPILVGDLNRDHKITSADARKLIRFDVYGAEDTSIEFRTADINEDDRISTVDVRWLLLKLIDV
ncbi:MAG: hypothetical protein IJU16_02590 [Clostridia bacterium]|nr:hypothetical protein [Clostridia bacterium]